MKTNNLYRAELKAARRLAKWVDGHPYLTNAIIATVGVICAIFALLYYPL